MTNIEDAHAPYALASIAWSGVKWHYPRIEKMVDELRRLRQIEAAARAANLIGPDGKVRKVLGTLPLTADGCIVGNGGRFWSPGGTVCGYCMAEDFDSAHWALVECYESKQAAEAARQKGNA